MQRRTVLVGIATVLAGCSTEEPTERNTPGPDAPPVQGGLADYPHDIRVENTLERTVTFNLTVEDGESTLYEGSHEVHSGANETVAGFTSETFPLERQYVTIQVATSEGETDTAAVSVTDCLGHVVVAFSEAGAPLLAFSQC